MGQVSPAKPLEGVQMVLAAAAFSSGVQSAAGHAVEGL
jgi:hypothetical protein